MNSSSIGDKIRILRTMRGYSQKGLAALSGLKQENISYLESNKSRKKINREKLSRIAIALEVSIDEIEKSDTGNLLENTGHDENKVAFLSENSLTNSQKILLLQQEVLNQLQKLNQLYEATLSNSQLKNPFIHESRL